MNGPIKLEDTNSAEILTLSHWLGATHPRDL